MSCQQKLGTTCRHPCYPSLFPFYFPCAWSMCRLQAMDAETPELSFLCAWQMTLGVCLTESGLSSPTPGNLHLNLQLLDQEARCRVAEDSAYGRSRLAEKIMLTYGLASYWNKRFVQVALALYNWLRTEPDEPSDGSPKHCKLATVAGNVSKAAPASGHSIGPQAFHPAKHSGSSWSCSFERVAGQGR